jgi:ABC-type uncharacterized transport system substrate-binding protein
MDVIAVDGPPAAKAAKAATTRIPIVFTLVVDPVAEGLATSMARPGANLTGLSSRWVSSWLENVWSCSRILNPTLPG